MSKSNKVSKRWLVLIHKLKCDKCGITEHRETDPKIAIVPEIPFNFRVFIDGWFFIFNDPDTGRKRTMKFIILVEATQHLVQISYVNSFGVKEVISVLKESWIKPYGKFHELGLDLH